MGCKGHTGTLWSDEHMYFTWHVHRCMYTIVKLHQTEHCISVHFIICKSHLSYRCTRVYKHTSPPCTMVLSTTTAHNPLSTLGGGGRFSLKLQLMKTGGFILKQNQNALTPTPHHHHPQDKAIAIFLWWVNGWVRSGDRHHGDPT